MKILSLPTVQVLERVLDIIEALAGAKDGLGISQVSGITQLPVSTVHRLLKVLKRRGYVRQDPETRKYMLSTRMLSPPQAGEGIGQVSGHAN